MNTKVKTYHEVSATIRKTDGTIVNLGVIVSNKPPTFLQKVKQWLQHLKRKSQIALKYPQNVL
jgi:hypothetical protein